MNVLLLGSGGREHAIAWKLSQSKKLGKLFIAPGNAGTATLGINADIALNDFEALAKFVIDENISMVVVGLEDPLVNGITDYFGNKPELQKIRIIGPGKIGATLEGSKEFAKEFMVRHNIPTAAYISITAENINEGFRFLENNNPPFVLKADGLAAGKGVLIIDSLEKAKAELSDMLNGKFGQASKKVVIEEFLQGIEMSAFVLTDGKSYKILPEAKDYKRAGEGDTGLNTGGMGCVSPVPFADNDFLKKVEERVIAPTIAGLQKDKIAYTGFIFFGLMNNNGNPSVIEYNVRLGDPEAEVVLPRLNTDLLELFIAASEQRLNETKIETINQTCVTVMLVSGGYPGNYDKGKEITNIENTIGSLIFHAGTKISGNKVVTNGGRVISVSSLGESLAVASEKSYYNASIIQFDGKYYRKDIGQDLLKYI
ncbi:MAG: phosphoribosylamine--glycine ligase [Bacteroidales bacterium]|nr:phosphoribosylamine--glycine ligase [Bacteroidales bacterium]